MLYKEMNQLSASEQMNEIPGTDDDWAASDDEASGSYL